MTSNSGPCACTVPVLDQHQAYSASRADFIDRGGLTLEDRQPQGPVAQDVRGRGKISLLARPIKDWPAVHLADPRGGLAMARPKATRLFLAADRVAGRVQQGLLAPTGATTSFWRGLVLCRRGAQRAPNIFRFCATVRCGNSAILNPYQAASCAAARRWPRSVSSSPRRSIRTRPAFQVQKAPNRVDHGRIFGPDRPNSAVMPGRASSARSAQSRQSGATGTARASCGLQIRFCNAAGSTSDKSTAGLRRMMMT